MPAVIPPKKFRSDRGLTIVEILVTGLIIVLISLMILPSVSNAVGGNQEKRVISNLRQLSDAAQLYFLRTGNSLVTFDQLVGPGRPIDQLTPVAGERYPQVIQRGQTEISATDSTISGKPVITYSP